MESESASLGLFIGKFTPFVFKTIIKRCLLIIVILLIVFLVGWIIVCYLLSHR